MQKCFSNLLFYYKENAIFQKSGKPDFFMRMVRFENKKTYIPSPIAAPATCSGAGDASTY